MKPIEVRLPEKSKPRVTVGRKATDRCRDGDGWVAEAEQMTFRLRIPNRLNLGKIEGGSVCPTVLVMARERVWPIRERVGGC